MEWARAACAALVFAPCPAAKATNTAAVAMARGARRRSGDPRPASAGSVHLPALLATATTMAVPSARRCRVPQRARALPLPLPQGWVLAATAAMGRSAAGRRGAAQRAASQAVRVPAREPVADFQVNLCRAGSKPAHFHALRSAPYRLAHRRREWKFKLQSHRIARW